MKTLLITAAALATIVGAVQAAADQITQKAEKRDSPAATQFVKIGRFTGHRGAVYRAIVSPDGQHGISCGEDKSIRIWDIATQVEKNILQGHQGRVFSLAVSSNGTLLASGDAENSIRLWDLKSGKPLGELAGHQGPVTALAFVPDQPRLLSVGWDKTLRIWDVEERKAVRTIDLGTVANEMQALAGGRQVVLSGADVRGWGVEFYDLEAGSRIEEKPSILSCFSVSHDGRRTLLGYINGLLKLLDTQSNEVVIQMVDAQGKAVMRAAISPDGKTAVTTTRENMMHLWDLTTGKLLTSIQDETIAFLSLSPDGRFALTLGREGGVGIWRLPESLGQQAAGTEKR